MVEHSGIWLLKLHKIFDCAVSANLFISSAWCAGSALFLTPVVVPHLGVP